MAPALKLWVGIALGGVALASVATLPPSVTEVRMQRERLPEEIRATELLADATRTAQLIRRMRWMDSLPALAVATARDGVAVGGDPRLVDADQLDLFGSRLRAELSRVARGDGRTVVGFFVVPPNPRGDLPGFGDARPRYELFAGTFQDTPYCLIVQFRSSHLMTPELGIWRDEAGGLHSQLLAGCRFVAAYGLPGAHVREWLARGGYQYAEGATPDTGDGAPVRSGRRDAFGRRVFPVDRVSLSPEHCVEGQAQACAELLLRETTNATDPADVTFQTAGFDRSMGASLVPSPAPILTDASRYLLSDLERERGADAFRAFWTSGQDVPEAFQAAFGVPLGEWTVGWVAAHLGLERYGPWLPRGAWLGTVLLVVLGAVAGGAFQRRRSVA